MRRLNLSSISMGMVTNALKLVILLFMDWGRAMGNFRGYVKKIDIIITYNKIIT